MKTPQCNKEHKYIRSFIGLILKVRVIISRERAEENINKRAAARNRVTRCDRNALEFQLIATGVVGSIASGRRIKVKRVTIYDLLLPARPAVTKNPMDCGNITFNASYATGNGPLGNNDS